MRFWLREVAGWALVLLGLMMFRLCYEQLVLEHRYFESGSLVVIGIFLFRGGIHLLKVAVAARICMRTQEQLAVSRPSTGRAAPSRHPAVVRTGWGP
jgi:hypothetical protein